MRNPTEGQLIAKFESIMEVHLLEESGGHCGRSTVGGVRRKFVRWRSPIGTVEVWLALLKVDGWKGTEDTGNSRSL